jgi:hypothetical protein
VERISRQPRCVKSKGKHCTFARGPLRVSGQTPVGIRSYRRTRGAVTIIICMSCMHPSPPRGWQRGMLLSLVAVIVHAGRHAHGVIGCRTGGSTCDWTTNMLRMAYRKRGGYCFCLVHVFSQASDTSTAAPAMPTGGIFQGQPRSTLRLHSRPAGKLTETESCRGP